METVKYTPTDDDLRRIEEIKAFFNEEEIPFVESTDEFGIFLLNEGTLQVRYVNSSFHKIDNSKRFGESHKGVPGNYCSHISQEAQRKGVRVVWVFDFEMDQVNADYEYEGKTVKGFRRQWEVIKNTLRTACGRIHYRFYARDCEIREVPNYELRPFLNTNCFYGYRSANTNLGLYLKKDKNGFKKGTLMIVYTFGGNFYGNKGKDEVKIEVIRASTRLHCQVIGGISKCIKHFCEEYPTLIIGKKEVNVERIIFYVDSSHNDSRGMENANSFFKFVSWDPQGFINVFLEDYENGKLKGRKGEVFMRRPLMHKEIMQGIKEHKIASIPNAGTIVYEMRRSEFMKAQEEKNGKQD